jgi:hypothetical protein
MALDTRLSNSARSAALASGLSAEFNTGYIRIYSGTRPATPDTALSGNTLLAELRHNATAFAAPSNGVATANAITQDSSADATGTATFARFFKSDGTTVLMDVEVGTSGANLNLNTVSIVAGAAVQITSWTLTVPMQGA